MENDTKTFHNDHIWLTTTGYIILKLYFKYKNLKDTIPINAVDSKSTRLVQETNDEEVSLQ